MQLILAVAEDLFSFAVQALFGVRAKSAAADVIYLDTPARGVIPLPSRAVQEIPPSESVAKPIVPEQVPSRITPRKNTVMYTASIDVPVRREPRTTDDTLIATLSYGTMVMVLDAIDGWSKVVAGEREGWVRTDDLADRAAYVYPQFSIGEQNDPDDPNTVRVRAMIGDVFLGGVRQLPLQSEEYVLYKLYRRGTRLKLPAPTEQPPRWSLLLRQLPNVAVYPEPKAGAIMQIHFKEDATIEHFAYVEAIFPDGSLQISEVNWPEDGIYNERVLVREEWHDLNPVFLVVA